MEKAKIPAPVRLEDADEARKVLYSGINEVRNEFKKNDVLPEPDQPDNPGGVKEEGPPAPIGTAQDIPESAGSVFEISEEDKKTFVRSILGNKAFRKTYMLFDAVKATFTDRSPNCTLAMYKQAKEEGVDEGSPEWGAVLNQYYLASTLTSLEVERDMDINNVDNLKAKIAKLKELPRPLYIALLDAAEHFETLVDVLVDKAQDRDFWKAGGSI